MRAMVLDRPGQPLAMRERPVPRPGTGEILVAVSACGVCRTDLHVVDGELPHPKLPIVPGHETVGRVAALGGGVVGFEIGQRVGVTWLGATCGVCPYCRSDRENLCDAPLFTGYTRDGGYATHAVADGRYCFALPDGLNDAAAAPLLCAGLIGWRSYRIAGEGAALGLYGEHLLAAGVDHPAAAAAERDRSVGLDRGQVAGDDPAPAAERAERLRGLRLVAQVAGLVVGGRGEHADLARTGDHVAPRVVNDAGAGRQREPRGDDVVAAPGLADRERAALGRGDHVTADEVAVRQQPALHVRAPGHADAQDAPQAGQVVRPAGLRRPVQRVGERQREHVTDDRDRVHALLGDRGG